MANPGAIWSRCVAGLLRGTCERCRGESTGLTHIVVAPDEKLTFGLKSWSRGQKSQDASLSCSGGVSAVMGSSDLDIHTLISGSAYSNQSSCLLPESVRLNEIGNPVSSHGDSLMADSSPTKKPRALTYTEMMNGGRQRIEDDACSDHPELELRLDPAQTPIESSPQTPQPDD